MALTKTQTITYAAVREQLEEEGYSVGAMQSTADLREAAHMMATEGERLVALAQDLRSKLDDADDDAKLDGQPEEQRHGD